MANTIKIKSGSGTPTTSDIVDKELAFDRDANKLYINDNGTIVDLSGSSSLDTEGVQDIVGAMFSSNTETRISATYQDGDGTIDLVVDDMTADTNTQLSTEEVQDIVGAMFSGNTETRITATYQDSDGTIDLVVDDLDTDTQLTTENVQDIVGAMFSSNTETRISATYQDGDGTIDLVVDDMTSDTNTNQLTTFTLTADSGSNQTIAHGNTLDIAGGTGISTSVGATDTVTVTLGNHSADLLTSGTVDAARLPTIDISSKTNLSAGTNISLSGDTLNVDDAFITNNADDTMSGVLTLSTSNDLPLRVLSTDAGSGISIGDNSTTSNYTTIVATGDSKLEFNVNNTERLELGAGSNGNIFRTDHGYIQFGPLNSGGTHIYTDTSQFFFNKRLTIGVTSGESIIAGYGDQADLVLARNHSDTDHDAIHIGDNDIEFHCNDVESVSINSSGITTSGNITLPASHSADKIVMYSGGNEKIGTEANTLLFTADNHKFKDTNGDTNVTFNNAGQIAAASLDISGDVDIDGTTNLDAVDIDGVITAADGSASNPQYSFGADTNSGMFRVSSDVVGIAAAGNSRFTVKGNGIKAVSGSLGVNTDPNSTDGMIHATNDIVAFSSDKRLKENIRPIENALDKVSKLSGFVYNWNELANEKAEYNMDKDYVGVYAQDVEEVQPEAVDLAPFDNDGEDNSISGDNYLTVKYDKLVPLLIESIKELKAEIEELKK